MSITSFQSCCLALLNPQPSLDDVAIRCKQQAAVIINAFLNTSPSLETPQDDSKAFLMDASHALIPGALPSPQIPPPVWTASGISAFLESAFVSFIQKTLVKAVGIALNTTVMTASITLGQALLPAMGLGVIIGILSGAALCALGHVLMESP